VSRLKEKARATNGHVRSSDHRPKAARTKATTARRSRSYTPDDSDDDSVSYSPNGVASTSAAAAVNGTKHAKRRRSPSVSPQRTALSGSRRKTMNSLSSFPAHGILALIPPGVPVDPETNLPAVPSHPPTPPEPDTIKPGGKGNLFTDRDAQFFLKYVSWKLANSPDCGKADIAEGLGEAVRRLRVT
jgi:hypothetical protein